MAEFSKKAREASMAARSANAEKRRKLAKKLGVKPGALLPSQLAKHPIPGAESLMKKAAPTKGKVGKTVHFPIEAIPDMRPVKRMTVKSAPIVSKTPQDDAMALVAKLIVAVAQEIYRNK